MADRLTQLQDTVNMVSEGKVPYPYFESKIVSLIQQADHFCNSIGILQQCAIPSKFPGFDRSGAQTPVQNVQEDYAQLFAQLISRCAKDIDTLIESLPNEDSSQESQIQSLKRLEQENQVAAERLEEVLVNYEYLKLD